VEASNLERVKENVVVRGGLDVIVPQPVEGREGGRQGEREGGREARRFPKLSLLWL
jgi:hypothetical protein